jgi:adhesin HecA-like repeat protein
MTPTASTLALAHGQRLAVDAGNVLRLFAADGQTTLTLLITPGGPVLQFSGGLAIHAEGNLALSGQTLDLHGREGVAISTGGDLRLHAERDLHSVARIQNITADLGNVNVRANDDVRIDGERVMVNCE